MKVADPLEDQHINMIIDNSSFRALYHQPNRLITVDCTGRAATYRLFLRHTQGSLKLREETKQKNWGIKGYLPSSTANIKLPISSQINLNPHTEIYLSVPIARYRSTAVKKKKV